MTTLILFLLVISSFINMYADILLVSGKDFSVKNQSSMDRARNTADKDLKLSGIIGLFCLSIWMTNLYFLSFIEGFIGKVIMLVYALFIASIITFHVVCSFVILLAKHSHMEETQLKKMFFVYLIPCLIWSIVYTALMIYLGFTGVLKMNFLQYLTLPIFSTIIIQFLLPKIIKIRHFDSIAGTLSMMVSILFTANIILMNV